MSESSTSSLSKPESQPNQQSPYVVDISHHVGNVVSGHLKLGGRSPQGRSIEFTNYYPLFNGKPCIPVMGEFHFSRYQSRYWEEELLKMRAGGITIVATYVFWNHIEEEEGQFDWSGNNNLRQFVQLCGKHQLDALVRIGPFAHGECRNGGLPDWLYGRAFRVRSNDADYLRYVERFYHKIGDQLKGLLFSDGGPVIGIQLDNEYMHCGAPWEVTFRRGTEWVPAGFDGVEHIVRLKQLAVNAGLIVPIYTCTGWLRSPIIEGEILPMQGGYAFTPWSPDPEYVQPPTREFLFRNRHIEPVLNGKPTYDAAQYPYACCEIGGGIQITYYHRPLVPPESVEALAVMNLAGGANLIGYYMYHGGSNPVGKHSFMNEYMVPRISYDFQAPIGEFGQVADSFRYLRLLHMFLADFGDVLAPMIVTLPEEAASITPEDTHHLRYAVRSEDDSGFLFLNNYQDHVETQPILDIRFQVQTRHGKFSLPHTEALDLAKDVSAILPFGLSLEGILLQYATAQLFTKVESEESISYFFFAPRDMFSEYAFAASTCELLGVSNATVVEEEPRHVIMVDPGLDCVITLRSLNGKIVRICTLTREQAERSCKLELLQKERLVISDGTLVKDGNACYLYSTDQNELDLFVYPPVEGRLTTPFGTLNEVIEGSFAHYTRNVPPQEISIDWDLLDDNRAVLKFPKTILEGISNLVLQIDYVGDIGNAYIDGKLVHDNFYNGQPWQIGLRHLDLTDETEMVILISPIRKNSAGLHYIPTGMAFQPDLDRESLAAIRSIRVVPEYKVPIDMLR